jgi:hypothetical protein
VGACAQGSSSIERIPIALDPPGPGHEAYTCVSFDASFLRHVWVQGIRWAPPASGPVALHHASLFAAASDFPAGPVACESMPAAILVHVWAPGSAPLRLPDDVALEIPTDTQRLVVQTHVLQLKDGSDASTAFLELEIGTTPPKEVAGWMGALAPVPAIPPHQSASSSGRCVFGGSLHIFSSWPHMHKAGASFRGDIVRADRREQILVDVPVWGFGEQRTYSVSVDVESGDAVRTSCSWWNDEDTAVLPGPRTEDEMCGQGLVVWPLSQAEWSGDCPSSDPRS